MTDLRNRVHMFARPHTKDKLRAFFTEILGCQVVVSSDAPGLPVPILADRLQQRVLRKVTRR